MWELVCGPQLKEANSALDTLSNCNGTMVAKNKLPRAVRRQVAAALHANFAAVFKAGPEPENVFSDRAKPPYAPKDSRVSHIKGFEWNRAPRSAPSPRPPP